MANICSFDARLVGKEEEVREVARYFFEYYSYELLDWRKFNESIQEFYKEIGLVQTNKIVNVSMSMYFIASEIVQLDLFKNITRKADALRIIKKFMTNRLKEYKHEDDYRESKKLFSQEWKKFEKGFKLKEFKKLLVVTDEVKENLPKGPHFWRIFDVDVTDVDCDKDGTSSMTLYGSCAWSVGSALLYGGYYKDWKYCEGQDWFKGTCLENVHEKFPSLKMEIFSEEYGCSFSEHIKMDENGIIEDVGNLVATYYESVEEAKEDGFEITEEQVGDYIYTELPDWFYPTDCNRSYEFDWSF